MTIPLFPVEVAREITSGLPSSADLKVVSVGRDGFEYATKRQADSADLPASEWICYHLGYRLQIALPQCSVLMSGADQHFGSRFEGGVIQWSSVTPTEQMGLLQSCASDISRICALDLFVANDDRHLNNFLFRQQTLAGGRTVIAMDFSRGLLIRNWPHDPVPMPPATNTMQLIELMRSLGFWDAAAAQLTLASLATISAKEVHDWLEKMPPSWLALSRKSAIVTWWGSQHMVQRISDCGNLV